MAHLLFVPDGDHPSFFLWGAASPSSGPSHRLEQTLTAKGEAHEAWIAGPTGVSTRRKGTAIGLLNAIAVLAAVPMDQVRDLPGSLGVWSAASKLALELASRGRFAPRLNQKDDAAEKGAWEACWEVSLADARDAERFFAIAQAMPPAAHAAPLGKVSGRPGKAPVWPKETLLHGFLCAAIDAIVREAVALHVRSSARAEAPANRSKCLHIQVDPSIQWELRYVFALVSKETALTFEAPGEQGLPEALGAWSLPAFRAGEGRVENAEPRVRVRMRLGGGGESSGAARDRAGEGERIDLSGALRFRWDVELDGVGLRAAEAKALLRAETSGVSSRRPLARADEAMLEAGLRLVAQGSGLLPARAALWALLAGRVAWPGLPAPAEVVADQALSVCLDSLSARGEGRAPDSADAYRIAERGLAWLTGRVSVGLGGWFVDEDDQARRLAAIGLLLHLENTKNAHTKNAKPRAVRLRRRAEPPPLVISADPAAWEVAVARAAPPLVPALHQGPLRAQSAADLRARAEGRGLVLAGYEELAIDADLLGAIEWPLVLFDEADQRAGSASAWSKAAHGLRARCRIGFAGAPIDGRCLGALWDALDLVSPGLLGSFEAFRRTIAAPIERFGDPDAEALTAKIVHFFIYRAVAPKSGVRVHADGGSACEEAGG
ncbi:MAG: SNF2-related protein [Polyangiaceae bacterium]|nr:SNF2-related protein [Polyangiaceae bacterium]